MRELFEQLLPAYVNWLDSLEPQLQWERGVAPYFFLVAFPATVAIVVASSAYLLFKRNWGGASAILIAGLLFAPVIALLGGALAFGLLFASPFLLALWLFDWLKRWLRPGDGQAINAERDYGNDYIAKWINDRESE